jgi:hypothetical protein
MLWIYRMTSLVSCCTRIVNQNKWPTLPLFIFSVCWCNHHHRSWPFLECRPKKLYFKILWKDDDWSYVIGLVLHENCKSKQVTDFTAWPSRCHDTIHVFKIHLLCKSIVKTLHYMPNVEEWRDTRTFSNLKSTHCTLLILLIINLVTKKSLCIDELWWWLHQQTEKIKLLGKYHRLKHI